MLSESQVAPSGIKREIVKGVIWSFAARWGVRALGLVSTVVLARLLNPEDFGLVAMATVFTSLIGAFLSLDMDSALIRITNLNDEHINTAWTLTVILGFCLGGVVFFSAPFIADYYDESQITSILQLLAFTPVVGCLRNPKTAIFRRHLNFSKDFKLLTTKKLLTVMSTVILAFLFMDYRALVYGAIIGGVLGVVVSYWMFPYNPRFSLSERDELLGFSLWLLVRNVGMVASSRIEQLIIGSNLGAERTSYYYMASEVGGMVTGEMALPIGRALLPGFSMVKNDPDRMLSGLKLSFAATTLVLPVGFGIAAISPELIMIVFGSKWMPVAPLLEILCIGGSIGMLGAPFGPLLLARGQAREVALIMAGVAIVILLYAIYFIGYGSLQIIAYGKSGGQIFIFLFLAHTALLPWKGELNHFLFVALRPLVASVIMFSLIKCGKFWFHLGPVAGVLVWSFLGVIIFCLSLYLLWKMTGEGRGLEELIKSFFMDKLKGRSFVD